jgi:hypothetical protein
MQFDKHDFASEVKMPANHITAQSLYCFHNDPFVYYRTYVQEKLPQPPVIRNTAEMLLKYKLFCGEESFDKKFVWNSPVNPSTKKPFGDDTQKFIDWCKVQKYDGLTPVHPSHVEIAETAYKEIVSQMEEGFQPTLASLLKPLGQAAIQSTASLDYNNCYAYADYLSENMVLCKLSTVQTFDYKANENWFAQLLTNSAFALAFQHAVFSKRTVLASVVYSIIVETALPCRVAVIEHAVEDLINIESVMQCLNNAYNNKDIKSAWKSKWNNISLGYTNTGEMIVY